MRSRQYPLVGAALALGLGGALSANAGPTRALDLTLPAGVLHAPLPNGVPFAVPATPRARVTFSWPEEAWDPAAQLSRTMVSLPTLQPNAPQPLIFDLTPPCSSGIQPRWSSFGSMPSAELVMAAYEGYPQHILCGP